MKPCIKTYRVILDGDDKAITCFVPATSDRTRVNGLRVTERLFNAKNMSCLLTRTICVTFLSVGRADILAKRKQTLSLGR